MRHLILLLAFSGWIMYGHSQNLDSLKFKKHFYVTWGYTHAVYSKSSIHFENHSNKYNPATGRYDNYDFTIYDVTARDRPDFNKIRDVVNVTIPQFVFRIGYSFNSKWGFELNYDHTKYVVDDYQKVRVQGQFNDNWVNNDTILDPLTFLHFEHTDGANFWMFNMVRRWSLLHPNKNLNVSWVLKPGAGFVVPRTDCTLFGQRLNNNWKLAGWIVGVETGMRVEFLRNGFFEFVGKASYADYVNCFVLGRGNGVANHHFSTAQLTGTIGLKFSSKR
ncbi:MAG: hypothetical protein PSX36_06585 [bacterium]|nr:hypothetical protein [bacterium]